MDENPRLAFLIVAVIAALFVQREFVDGGAERAATIGGEQVALGLLDGRALETDRPAPDFALDVLDGEPARLSDFRGKTVVLNFWASWCPLAAEACLMFIARRPFRPAAARPDHTPGAPAGARRRALSRRRACRPRCRRRRRRSPAGRRRQGRRRWCGRRPGGR